MRLRLLKEGDSNSPYYLFSQAEIHLQWALTRIKFEEYLKAAIEVNKAIGMLERNRKKFPDFISNNKSLSILHAVAGTIPKKYKGVLGVISNFDGTIDEGIREIDKVLEYAKSNDYFFQDEAIAIKALILLHLKGKDKEAWNFLNTSGLDHDKNPLASFLYASVASKNGNNEEVIEILKGRKRSIQAYPFYYLDLMLGTAKLSRLDADADVYIKTYINYFKGKNYIKDAYRKLAWHGLVVKGDETLYLQNMVNCMERGEQVIEEDKAALNEAHRKSIPNKLLLRSRILFDGGYGKKALKDLESINTEGLNEDDQIEYHYRKGRVYQVLNNDKAFESFVECLALGESSDLYFACNAALQLGILYEDDGDPVKAKTYFKKCVSLNPSEYKNGLHQKAKAGLKRLK